jgi:hypothetical protein
MLDPLLRTYSGFIYLVSLLKIWDLGLRILDLWNRYALFINME